MRESEPYTKHQESSPEGLLARHELALATVTRLKVNPIFKGAEFPTFIGHWREKDEQEATSVQERNENDVRMARQLAFIVENRSDRSNVAIAAEYFEAT